MHEPDDVILAAPAHRIARVVVLTNDRLVLFQRVLNVKERHIGAWRHDGLGVLLAQIKHVVHKLVLLFGDQTALGGFVHQDLDLVAGVHLVLVGRIVPQQAHHSVRDGVEQPHDGIRDAVEPHERRGRGQGVPLGGEDGQRLRDQLACHHMQRGHDEITDGYRTDSDDRLGRTEQLEQRADQRSEDRFAQPAQGQRCQRDTQLACAQIGVHIPRDDQRVLRAALAVGHGYLKLRLAHTHQRELRNDEERVHG